MNDAEFSDESTARQSSKGSRSLSHSSLKNPIISVSIMSFLQMRILLLAWAFIVSVSFTTRADTVATGFPDATNTGVPAGVILTPSGDLVINTPGVIISGLDIHGTVTINADNVTLENCRITASDPNAWAVINITSGRTGVVVQDCEINGMGAVGVRGISGQGTFLRNNIHDTEDGIYVLGPTLVQDCYIHDLLTNWSGPHYDGIAIDGGSNVTIRHNTIINPHDQTSAVMIDNYFGPVSNITVDNNLLVGGAYTIFVDGQFSGGSITNVSITNNRLGKGKWGYVATTQTSPVLKENFDYITRHPITYGTSE